MPKIWRNIKRISKSTLKHMEVLQEKIEVDLEEVEAENPERDAASLERADLSLPKASQNHQRVNQVARAERARVVTEARARAKAEVKVPKQVVRKFASPAALQRRNQPLALRARENQAPDLNQRVARDQRAGAKHQAKVNQSRREDLNQEADPTLQAKENPPKARADLRVAKEKVQPQRFILKTKATRRR